MTGKSRVFACFAVAVGVMWGQDATNGVPRKPIANWHAPERWLAPSAQEGLRNAQAGVVGNTLEIGSAGVNGLTPAAAAGATQPLTFVAITPCRIMDTRNGSGFTGAFGPPGLQSNAVRTVPIPSSACGVPSSAAYSLNFTLVTTTPVLFLSAFPNTFQNTSVLNDLLGTDIANGAVVASAADGSIKVMASDPTDLLIDINGYYVSVPPANALATAFSAANYRIGPVAGTGVNPATHIGVGATTTISANYFVDAVAGCPGCIEQLVVGIVGQPNAQGCLFDGGPATGATGTGTVTLTAPTTPGIYYVGVRSALQFGCSNALPGNGYDGNIASITVY